jgi:Tfp pilus assembly protein PilF
MKAFDAADYEQAAAAFMDATRQNPRDYKSFYMAGQCYEKLNLEQKTIFSYKSGLNAMQATEIGRGDEEFKGKIIEALSSYLARAASRESEIEALIQSARRLDVPSQRAAQDWVVLAKVYANLGDADNAIDAYNRASLLAPGDFNLAKTYGLYLESLAQPRRAEPYLIRAYQLNPEDVEVARALRRIGVVPGPSLLNQADLARPIVPEGPLPELKLFPTQSPPARP